VEACAGVRQKVFGESVEGMGQGRRMRKGPLELLEGRGGQECPTHEELCFRSCRVGATEQTRETSFAGSIPQTLGGAVRSNEGLRQFRRRGHPGAGWQGCEIIARRSMRRIAIPTVRGPCGWRDAILANLWECFQVGILRQGKSGSFRAPAGQTGKAVGAVADRGEVVGN